MKPERTRGFPHWRIMPPLPDPIGFGGMFAGVSNEVLFAGGGSRFLQPPWDGGNKVFSDEVFVLKTLNGSWEKLEKRLPLPIAHSASTPYANGALSAGGINESGPRRDVNWVGLRNGELEVKILPFLPDPLVYGAAAVVRDVFYVVGGVPNASSTQPTNQCWALSLVSPPTEWLRMPDLPGKAASVMTAGSDGNFLYVFGGMEFLPDRQGGVLPAPLNYAYRFNPASGVWTHLESMPVARAGAASPSMQLPDGRFLIAGGYEKVFSGKPEEHPGFENETLYYSPATNHWTKGPELPCERRIDRSLSSSPGPEPMVTAPNVIWREQLVLISGEVRPATRSPAVICLNLKDVF